MSLWLIACKYTGENLIGDCVASIREHHPDDRILVVDSCSDDLSYLQHLGCDIATGNRHYPVGAWRYARGILMDSASTGNSTGPHLHFAIKVDGTVRCPQALLVSIADGAPVTPDSLATGGCTY